MCGQHNVRTIDEDNTVQNTDKGHKSSPGIEMSDSAENRTRVAGLEDRDSTDYATATGLQILY